MCVLVYYRVSQTLMEHQKPGGCMSWDVIYAVNSCCNFANWSTTSVMWCYNVPIIYVMHVSRKTSSGARCVCLFDATSIKLGYLSIIYLLTYSKIFADRRLRLDRCLSLTDISASWTPAENSSISSSSIYQWLTTVTRFHAGRQTPVTTAAVVTSTSYPTHVHGGPKPNTSFSQKFIKLTRPWIEWLILSTWIARFILHLHISEVMYNDLNYNCISR
jgi:hypothetical protein